MKTRWKSLKLVCLFAKSLPSKKKNDKKSHYVSQNCVDRKYYFLQDFYLKNKFGVHVTNQYSVGGKGTILATTVASNYAAH